MSFKLKICIACDEGEISSDENPDLLHLTKGALNLLIQALNKEKPRSHRWSEENVKQLEKYGFIKVTFSDEDTYHFHLIEKLTWKRVSYRSDVEVVSRMDEVA